MAPSKPRPQRPTTRPQTAPCLPAPNPYAAGIDVGAYEMYVAVPPECSPEPVQSFTTFTEDLHRLADWLVACGIKTIAMESTGVYWIPLFQILETRGFEVCLVNARHVKNVPGRKTDVSDCQWLQYLHAVGLLRGSFRPPDAVCAVRAVLRHRDLLVSYAAAHVQHMQKALTQMNLQLHHVLSDITGQSGVAILRAILAGERDPQKLAKLRDRRVRATPEQIAKSLVGDWREEHLFTLRQAFAAYEQYQQWITECDQEIERLLEQLPDTVDPRDQPPPPPRYKPTKPPKNEVALPEHDLRSELYRILGVDLTQIPGLRTPNVHALLCELGWDLSAFPTSKHFASWLGFCPDNRLSGRRLLSAKTRKIPSRAAKIFRVAAMTLDRSDSHLGAFYRTMRSRLGAPKAITAAAHKLARIVYELLTTRQPYDESLHARHESQHRQKRVRRLQRDAQALGFNLTPRAEVS